MTGVEIIADGLSLFRDVQLVVHTLLNPTLRDDDMSRRGASRTGGVALQEARVRIEGIFPRTCERGGEGQTHDTRW